ncbi:xanthine phosphoribosyltransferase [Floccifex porci]|uniref:Xanthine phosphoribosyltransferase n=1 Tax=Floccifex porci TaxID=2606629 RepID=A0A7X2N2X7_9FIRM|nr:xanthine phosphoribosyltransferase [Floccifex porci]MSS01509.1 xanthine phosphoribosyltransferase [Floccifex porci]
MKLLEDKIREEGILLKGNVLKVDSFLNHQMDVELLDEMGKEFYQHFKDKKINKILTIESSGIGIAVMCAKYFGYPKVVFAKKGNSSNLTGDIYCCKEKSYTRNVEYNVQVSKRFLKEEDHVLIIDDFLANGEALNALIDICRQANATVEGCGIVITKSYQKGLKRIQDMGIEVFSLANIKKMENEIEFV